MTVCLVFRCSVFRCSVLRSPLYQKVFETKHEKWIIYKKVIVENEFPHMDFLTHCFFRNTPSLSFDDTNGPELDTLFADAGRMARVDHVRHVFVGLWGLLHHQLWRGHSNGDAFGCKFVQNFLVIQITTGFGSENK